MKLFFGINNSKNIKKTGCHTAEFQKYSENDKRTVRTKKNENKESCKKVNDSASTHSPREKQYMKSDADLKYSNNETKGMNRNNKQTNKQPSKFFFYLSKHRTAGSSLPMLCSWQMDTRHHSNRKSPAFKCFIMCTSTHARKHTYSGTYTSTSRPFLSIL